MNLDDWRSRINDLDNQILHLLNQRAEAALQIGDLKRRQDLPSYAPDREAEIVTRLSAANGGPLPAAAIRAIWREILSGCRALERALSVAFLGPRATFTQQAAGDVTIAAIASDLAAELYGVRVLRPRIEDNPHNATRFLVIGRRAVGPSARDKTSILFAMRNEPGVLYRILEPFARRGINLIKIETRPAKSRPWEFVTFLDFEGHRDTPTVAAALNEIEGRTLFLKVLGSYPAA